MEQTKALNALEPFLALSKSATSPAAAADLIQRATSAPNTFVFSELLQTPQIQAIRNDEGSYPHFWLLSQFCFGTYDSFIQVAPTLKLPALNDAQTLKLRQLSLLTHARDPKNLTYKRLVQLLGLGGGVKELEGLVISAIYAGLLHATLDPYNQRVCVSSTAPLRDVDPESIPCLIETLQEWSGRCSATLSGLEKQIAMIKAEALRRHKEEQEWDAYVEGLVKDEAESKTQKKDATAGKKLSGGRQPNSKRGFMGLGGASRGYAYADDGDMDVDMVDEADETQKDSGPRSQKKRGLGRGSVFGR